MTDANCRREQSALTAFLEAFRGVKLPKTWLEPRRAAALHPFSLSAISALPSKNPERKVAGPLHLSFSGGQTAA